MAMSPSEMRAWSDMVGSPVEEEAEDALEAWFGDHRKLLYQENGTTTGNEIIFYNPAPFGGIELHVVNIGLEGKRNYPERFPYIFGVGDVR